MIDKPPAPPTRQAGAVAERSAPLRVTGKLKRALDGMVWQALTRQEAAKAAGLKEHSLYSALRKPHVTRYYLAACEVLRTSGRARRILRLEELSEQNENRGAAVNAIRAAENLGDDPLARGGQVQQQPGLVIQIISMPLPPQGQAPARVITIEPLAPAEPEDERDGRDPFDLA